jgi:hemerythrin
MPANGERAALERPGEWVDPPYQWKITMTLLWRDALSVGNDQIDSDHKCLLALINAVEVLLTAENPLSDLCAALDKLADYTHHHFAREERLMISLHYLKYDAHKHAHGELISQLDEAAKPVKDLPEDPNQTTSKIPEEARSKLVALLRHWLLDHIIKEDMLLKPLLAKHPKGLVL